MRIFWANRPYNAALDVRVYGDLPELIQTKPPAGALWLFLAPRRGRKTWTLEAMKHRLSDPRSSAGAKPVHLVNLREVESLEADEHLGSAPAGTCLLLDEPLPWVQKPDDARALLDRCVSLHKGGARILLALTPLELSLLQAVDAGRGYVSPKAFLRLEPFSAEEARAQAARSDAAKTILEELLKAHPIWTRSPFLLELLFEIAEQKPALSVPELLRVAVQRCEQTGTEYFNYVFYNGLTDGHREILRGVAERRSPPPFEQCEPLVDAGLIERDGDAEHYRFADPLLDVHLSPLRIHHISDVHAGPKAAGVTDVKDKGTLGKAADEGLVRESYLRHVQALRARGEGPHLLLVSGDLAEYATKEQYGEITSWLKGIEAALEDHPRLDAAAPRVLLTGGNHDVDWGQTVGKDMRARHLPFAEAFAGYKRPELEKEPDRRPVATAKYVDLGLEILLLGSAELGGQVDEDPYQARLWIERNRLPAGASDKQREDADKRALQAARDDPGFVHPSDIQRAKSHKWTQKVRIAVLHHPVSPPPVVEVARYAGLLNAGAVKAMLTENKFCLVLHGHAHAGWLGCEQWFEATKTRLLRIAAAPSLGSVEVREPHGYNLIEILRDRTKEGERTHRVRVMRFVYQGQTWEPSGAEMGPFVPGE